MTTAPLTDMVLEAADLEAAFRSCEALTATERRVRDAKLELGPDVSGAEIALLAGVSEGSERVLTGRLRRKLRAVR